ncbi:MAG: hypothetical protein IJ037_04230 [Clostridia bacterium]|nr:hypothetical protein [Clostridia bacterium]
MIYLISAVFLTVFLAAVTVFERKKPSPCWKRINLGLFLAGVLLVVLCRVTAGVMISSSGQTETWMEWAHDMLAQHYAISFPVLLVLTGILLIAWLLSMTEKRRRSTVGLFLRRTVGILASVSLLLLAPLYAFMTENDSVPLEALILLSGIGEALILRLTDALEGFFPPRNR